VRNRRLQLFLSTRLPLRPVWRPDETATVAPDSITACDGEENQANARARFQDEANEIHGHGFFKTFTSQESSLAPTNIAWRHLMRM